MARGGSNPMQEHHKKQRQRQVQKNKQQRSKARDEKVVQTKTVESVKEEIRALEKRGKHHKLQAPEEQKLQRLKKELKLVQEAAEAAKKAQAEQEHASRFQPKQRSLTELDDPRKSVYYDAQFNPYGAPPPGKPRLYHQRGGGVTMDIRMAVVPGEEEPPPPPPPPQPTEQQRHQHHKPSPSRPPPGPQQSVTSSSPRPTQSPPSKQEAKPPQEEAAPSTDEEEKSEEKNEEPSASTEQETKKLSPKKPVAIPSLPPASQAVQRTQRCRKQAGMADIWASNEEVEYERQINNIDVEADDVGSSLKTKKTKKHKKKKVPLEYYYQDRAGQVQGPFTKSQMMGWMEAGYFPLDTTMVKTSRNEDWIPMGDVTSLQKQKAAPEKSSVEDRVAALKNGGATNVQDEDEAEGMSIQARIAALKGGAPKEPQEDAEAMSVQARIAALKGEAPKAQEDDTEQDSNNESSIEDRIAALRGQAPGPNQPDDDNMALRPSYPEDDNQESEMGVAPYPAAAVDDQDGGVAPYPAVEDGDASGVATYPVAPYHATGHEAEDLVEAYSVAPYPVAEEDNDGGVLAYPVAPYPTGDGDDDDMAVAAYPTEHAEDDGAVAAYPTDTAYPAGDDLAYPVTDAYPTGEEDGGMDATEAYPPPASGVAVEETAVAAPKKTIKVDSALVAFLPSHLQAKKRKSNESAKESTVPRPKKVKASPAAADGGNGQSKDDYDKFMEEIEGLE